MPNETMMIKKLDELRIRAVVNPLIRNPTDPPGMDCFADDREALNDFTKYYNNSHLSDVALLVGDEIYAAHRIILTKSSEVFDQMLSKKWNGDKKELELVEDLSCQPVFPAFLRFLYCNHVFLHAENTLPILILADKYNVNNLKKVCIDYAVNNILPELSTRELFHVWFSYATKAFHQPLINACIKVLAWHFEEMIMNEEWEKEWLSVDRDQLIELLKSNDLVLPNEFRLWEAVQKWLTVSSHPERRGNTALPLLASIIPYIKFPFMTADELTMVERSPLVEIHPKLFHPQILLAYKFQALPLASRASFKEFTGSQFILRNYTDIRWDKRITVRADELRRENGYDRGIDQAYNITTRSSTFPLQAWNWKLKLANQLVPNSHDELRMFLVSDDIDQPRSIEYLVQIVDERKVIRSFSSKRNFTKTRYSADIEIEKKVDLSEFYTDNSPLLVNGELHLQIILRPID
ncbi:BTB/POZ domain-containing protein [Dirofilaria immitis]